MERLMIEDANLLSQAKQVFGDDLIVAAFVSVEFDENSIFGDKDSYTKMLKNQLCSSCDLDDDGLMQFETGETIIEFSNGNKIRFNVSEWLVIEKIN